MGRRHGKIKSGTKSRIHSAGAHCKARRQVGGEGSRQVSAHVENLLGGMRSDVAKRIGVVGLGTFHREESFARISIDFALQKACRIRDCGLAHFLDGRLRRFGVVDHGEAAALVMCAGTAWCIAQAGAVFSSKILEEEEDMARGAKSMGVGSGGGARRGGIKREWEGSCGLSGPSRDPCALHCPL